MAKIISAELAVWDILTWLEDRFRVGISMSQENGSHEGSWFMGFHEA